jgi:DNA-binding NarL/FixJ family response regulator
MLFSKGSFSWTFFAIRRKDVAPEIIRVILVDDHAVVRAGLKTILSKAPDIEVIGEARNGREAVGFVERFHPEVVVMDLDMAGGNGTEATKDIMALGSGTRVLILTMHEEGEHLTPALHAGAAGYLVKTAADRELVDAIRAVAYGDVYLRPSAAKMVVQQLVRKDPGHAEREKFDTLSEREGGVFRLVARGYSGPEIGKQLNISAKTVETYKQRIHEKLGVSHRAEYIQMAVKLKLLDD